MSNLLQNTGYFRLAITASGFSNHRYRVGAVIVKKRPISVGFNFSKTHPKFADGKTFYTIHAECNAILRARRDLSGSNIFVYREDSEGNPVLAKPCNNCLKIIIESGIRRIFYSKSKYPYYGEIKL